MSAAEASVSIDGVAIIGMAGRFPGAKSVDEFWQNLRDGVESISFFSDEELAASGIDVDAVRRDPTYVRARGILPDAELFDAAFFGIGPKEAEVMDPQHRLFLETAWQALEHAGYDPEAYRGSIGVYAGISQNTYFLTHLRPRPDVLELVSPELVSMGNEKDYLPMRVSYKLNLKGPSVNVNTTCSTSLVAVCLAYQALLSYQCDMALAGGVSVTVPQKRGYYYDEGGICSPDGHCRAFDTKGQGTVFSNGVGIVVLKRLGDALADGDTIHAVIRGAAMNNDGSSKVSFAAPSVDGQAEAIAMAQAVAGVDAGTISYIEAHGTATPLGDPIEIAGLTQAFRASTSAKGVCAIGSVKTNIGHLDAAAGVAGLIKTTLALEHKVLPPSLHFEEPSPKIDFLNSPFYVNTALRPWERATMPRRAGVSSFGTGGTNAHVVLEEAPLVSPPGVSRRCHLLLISAKSEVALDEATRNLGRHLQSHPELDLADVAYTLHAGRRHFSHRRMLVCSDVNDAAAVLCAEDPTRFLSSRQASRDAPVVFMFPGQGAQAPNMGRGLYGSEPVFRKQVDLCCEMLRPHLGLDLRAVLYPDESGVAEAQQKLNETSLTQPALFVVEYALAQLWLAWGIRPASMIGHSLGEYVAACLAGVFTLEDALGLVAARAHLMQEQPRGTMLAVKLPAEELESLLGERAVSLAAINGPALSVVSGPSDDIEELSRILADRQVVCRTLSTSHAFHSPMMEPVVEPFATLVRNVRRASPQVPWVSSLTGDWITEIEAVDPGYWARQLRETVCFSAGVRRLLSVPHQILLEVGPGQTLTQLAKQHLEKGGQLILSTLPPASVEDRDVESLLRVAGQLWLAGVPVEWSGFHERRRRVPLPTYPFERKRFWVEPPCLGGRSRPPEPDEWRLEAGAAAMPAPDDSAGASVGRQGDARNQPVTAVELPAGRQGRIVGTLARLLSESSGVGLSDTDRDANLLELGLDSLSLTQANLAIQKTFGVKITFRQMLEELSTIDALAAYVEQHAPPEIFPPVPAEDSRVLPVPEALPVVTALGSWPGSTPEGWEAKGAMSDRADDRRDAVTALERIMIEQLRVMARQLEMLGGRPEGRVSDAEPILSRSLSPVLPAGAGSESSSTARPRVTAAGDQGVPTEDVADRAVRRFGPYKPIQKGPHGGLDSHQQKYVDQLVARYTKRTAESKRLTALHRDHLADPRTVAGFKMSWKEMVYPIVSARSSGSRVWDVDGNEYVDLIMGFGAILFGHSPSFITSAVREQLERGVECGPQSPLAGKVAELICEFTGMERAAFCNTGSEAVMAAVRAARAVSGRNRIAFFTGDYHGNYDEVLGRGVVVDGRLRTMPIAPGIPQSLVENALVLEYGSSRAIEVLASEADQLAAVLVEPIQGRRPDFFPKEFLQEVRALTARTETALIFDEIVTGFRVHPGGMQALCGIQADIGTYGKVLGGGFPIGVVAGKRKYMDALDGGHWEYGDASFPEVGVTFFAGTFVRHPLVLAAAWAVLNHLKESGPELQRGLNERTARFVTAANAYLAETRVPFGLQHFTPSSWFYLEIPPELKLGGLLFYHLREKGVHIFEGRSGIFSTAHTDEDFDFVLRAFKESIAEMQGGGALPAATSAAAGDGEHVPLTDSQMEIWLASQLGDDASRAFNLCFKIDLTGALDLGALRAAIQAVISRHEALRSSVSALGESLRFAPDLRVDIPLQDMSGEAAGKAEACVAELLRQENETAFDLTRGPLVRAQIVRLAAERHVLLFSVHHIACDGFSMRTVLRDLTAAYAAACEGTRAALPPPSPYRAYAQWQLEQQAGSDYAATEAYWLEQFAEPPPPLELPTARPRPRVATYRCGEIITALDSPLVSGLKRVGARHGSTLFSVLLAGFDVVLHRLSGQTDLVVAALAAGQWLAGSDDLVGHCVNVLPFRLRVDPDQSLGEHVRAVGRTVLAAYDRRNFTVGRLIRKLRLRRDPSRSPLFAVQFNFEQVRPRFEFCGLQSEISFRGRRFHAFDLAVNLAESDGEIELTCWFNQDLFESETVELWMGYYRTLLEALVADADQRISSAPLLSSAARQRLAATRRVGPIAPPPGFREFPREALAQSIVTRFEQQVREHDDRVAVSTPEETWTYAELNRRANRAAHAILAERGEGPERVALVFEHGAPMIAGILGALKAGKAYVPLDPAYPRDRLAYMVTDAEVQAFVTGPRHRRLAQDLAPESAAVVDINAARGRGWDQDPGRSIPPDALAYILYTSGSTGEPKGVMQSHRNVLHFMHVYTNNLHIGPDDGLTLLPSYSFDAAVMDIFGAVLNGARLCLWDVKSVGLAGLAPWLGRQAVTIYHSTPTLYRHFVRTLAGQELPTVRLVVLGGEEVYRDDVERFKAHFAASCVFVNGFGPTESTVSLQYFIDHQTPVTRTAVPIGYPVADTDVLLLSDAGADGDVAGEIAIRSAHVALGYWRKPELTEAVFRPDPAGGNRRTYRTGDLGRLLPDGSIEFVGRRDLQVKIRGYRIELGEIEAVLRQHEAVSDAAVVARVDAAGERRLIGYVAATARRPELVAEIRRLLRAKLPDYMLPSSIAVLDALPLTPSGKVDRRALPAPASDGGGREREFAAPRNETEATLAEIWATVLGVEMLGVFDNFFELGGDSLLAVRISTRIREVFAVDLPVRALFEASTVAELAEYLEARRWAQQDGQWVPAGCDREEIEF